MVNAISQKIEKTTLEFKQSKVEGRKQIFYPSLQELPAMFEELINMIQSPNELNELEIQKLIRVIGYFQVMQAMEIPNQFYEEFIRMIIPSFKIIKVVKGEIIYKLNEEQPYFYILLNGQVDIFAPKSFQDVQNEIEIKKQEEIDEETQKNKKKKQFDENDNLLNLKKQQQYLQENHIQTFNRILEENKKMRIFDSNGILLYKKIDSIIQKGQDFGYSQKKKTFAFGGNDNCLILQISLQTIKDASQIILQKIEQNIQQIKPFFKGYHQLTINSNLYLILDGEVDIIQKRQQSSLIKSQQLSKKKHYRYLKEVKDIQNDSAEDFDQLAQMQEVKANSVGNTLKKQENIRLTIFSKGQLFGEEDLFFNNNKRTSSAIAASQSLTLLSINLNLLVNEIHVEGYLENLKKQAEQKLKSRSEREQILNEASNNKLIFINDQHNEDIKTEFLNEQKAITADQSSNNNLRNYYSEEYLKEQQKEIIKNDMTYQTEVIQRTSDLNFKNFNSLPREQFTLPVLTEHMYPEGTYKQPYNPYLFQLKNTYKVKYKKSFTQQNSDSSSNILNQINNLSIPDKLSMILKNNNYSHQKNVIFKDPRSKNLKEDSLLNKTDQGEQSELQLDNKVQFINQEQQSPMSKYSMQFLTEIPIQQETEQVIQQKSNTDKLLESAQRIRSKTINSSAILKKSSSLNNLARLQNYQSQNQLNKSNLKYESTGYSYNSTNVQNTDNSQDKLIKEQTSFIKLPIIQPPQIQQQIKTRSISETKFKSIPHPINQNMYLKKYLRMKIMSSNHLNKF